MPQSLIASERETIIRTSDEDELVHVWTAQRAYITSLRRHAAVTEVGKGFIGKTEWAEFTIPRERWSPLGVKRTMNLSAEERTARAERLRGTR